MDAAVGMDDGIEVVGETEGAGVGAAVLPFLLRDLLRVFKRPEFTVGGNFYRKNIEN